ncbi:MAG: hypothetical protein Q8K78_08015 [Planctomycetaceae bacterium]|nr:hypothetical protein [Planctomycetaceae bacterium]
MRKLGALAVAALLAIGCAEAAKPAPSSPAADPAKLMEGMPKPAEGTPTPADPAAAPTDPAAAPTEKAPEAAADPAATPTPTPEGEKKE